MSAYKYVQPARDEKGLLLATGELKHGFKIGSVVHLEFVLREALTSDLLAAEKDAGAQMPLSFNTAALARQLVRVGTYAGPFTLGMLEGLRTRDWNILREAQAELDLAGEAE